MICQMNLFKFFPLPTKLEVSGAILMIISEFGPLCSFLSNLYVIVIQKCPLYIMPLEVCFLSNLYSQQSW